MTYEEWLLDSLNNMSIDQKCESQNVPVEELKRLVDDWNHMVAENEQFRASCEAIGPWMSAALDDPNVCPEMKRDIQTFFIALNLYEPRSKWETIPVYDEILFAKPYQTCDTLLDEPVRSEKEQIDRMCNINDILQEIKKPKIF
jgi:hypothetical protein